SLTLDAAASVKISGEGGACRSMDSVWVFIRHSWQPCRAAQSRNYYNIRGLLGGRQIDLAGNPQCAAFKNIERDGLRREVFGNAQQAAAAQKLVEDQILAFGTAGGGGVGAAGSQGGLQRYFNRFTLLDTRGHKLHVAFERPVVLGIAHQQHLVLQGGAQSLDIKGPDADGPLGAGRQQLVEKSQLVSGLPQFRLGRLQCG